MFALFNCILQRTSFIEYGLGLPHGNPPCLHAAKKSLGLHAHAKIAQLLLRTLFVVWAWEAALQLASLVFGMFG